MARLKKGQTKIILKLIIDENNPRPKLEKLLEEIMAELAKEN